MVTPTPQYIAIPKIPLEQRLARKEVGIAYILLIISGALGGHRYYLGNKGHAAAFTVLGVIWIFLGVGAFGTPGLMSVVLVIGLALGIMLLIDVINLAGAVRRYNNLNGWPN